MNFLPHADLHGSIDSLWIYPVKSCAGLSLTEAQLTPTGLAMDRTWMVVDAQGEFLTQRRLPRMALVQPVLAGGGLQLIAPGMPVLDVPGIACETPVATQIRPVLAVRVWNDTVPAWDEGEAAARWFSSFLGQACRLVRFPPAHQRLSSAKWTGAVQASNQFADGFPLLVASAAAMRELNARVQASGHAAVGVERFRPNLVLGGVDAHDEDRIEDLHIDTSGGPRNGADCGAEGAAVHLRMVKPCIRCAIPDVDPATAESTPAVGDALRSYRQDPRMDGAITFGMNAIVVGGVGQWLRVGQRLAADWHFG